MMDNMVLINTPSEANSSFPPNSLLNITALAATGIPVTITGTPAIIGLNPKFLTISKIITGKTINFNTQYMYKRTLEKKYF